MKTTNVYNLIILDESGSMHSIKHSTISGFNEVIQTIQGIKGKFPEQSHYVSLITFNGMGIQTVLDRKSVDKLIPLDGANYHPNSSTPLYDAIGNSVLNLNKEIGSNVENFNVLVTILTDGEENASKEYSHDQIKSIIEELKESNWTFTYIGANHDVEKTSFSLSIDNHLTFTANEADVKKMFEKDSKARKLFSQKLSMGLNVMTNYFSESDED